MWRKCAACRRGVLAAAALAAGILWLGGGRASSAADAKEPFFAGQQEVLYRDSADEIVVAGGNIVSVTFSSSNQKVAVVDQVGLVSGVEEGKAEIRAKVQYELGGETKTKELSYELRVIDDFTNYFEFANGEVKNLKDKGRACKDMHIPDYCNQIKVARGDWEKILNRNSVVERIWVSDYMEGFCDIGFRNGEDAPRSLREIYLGKSVYSFGDLYGASALEKISTHPKNYRFWAEDGVLYDEEMLVCYPAAKKQAAFDVPADVMLIDAYAFAGAKNLAKITLPNKLQSIYWGAFLNSGLTEISIPAKASLSPEAFANCEKLQRVVLPNNVGADQAIFKNCPVLKTVIVPNTAKYISGKSFQNCPRLTEFQLSPGVSDFQVKAGVLLKKSTKELAAYPMAKRDAAYKVPKGIKKIGEGGFYGASYLKEIQLDDALTEIDQEAFVNCSSLKKLRIPKKVKTISVWGNLGVFWGCTSLEKITVDSRNHSFTASKGILYSKSKKVLYCYPPAKKGNKYTVPKKVTRIKIAAAANTRYLQKIVIGSRVKVIERRAFMNGKALKSVTLSSKLGGISSSTFRNCKKLTKMVLPDRLESVHGNLCQNCTSLREVVLGKNVEHVSRNAFSQCSNLRKITFKGKRWLKMHTDSNPDNAPTNSFYLAGSKNYGRLTVHVPKCTKSQKKKCKKILWDSGLHKRAKIKFAK